MSDEELDNVEGRIGGTYYLSETALVKLLNEGYDDAWVDGVITVDGKAVYEEDLVSFMCEPKGDTAIVMQCGSYQGDEVPTGSSVDIAGNDEYNIRLGHQGSCVLHVDDEEFVPSFCGVFVTTYRDMSGVVEEIEAARARGDEDEVQRIAAREIPSIARAQFREMVAGLEGDDA